MACQFCLNENFALVRAVFTLHRKVVVCLMQEALHPNSASRAAQVQMISVIRPI